MNENVCSHNFSGCDTPPDEEWIIFEDEGEEEIEKEGGEEIEKEGEEDIEQESAEENG